MPASLDNWIPHCHIRLRHARTSGAPPERLWQAASELRLTDTPTMRRMIRWRLGSHAPDADTTYRELFRSGIFMLLEEGDLFSVPGSPDGSGTHPGNTPGLRTRPTIGSTTARAPQRSHC